MFTTRRIRNEARLTFNHPSPGTVTPGHVQQLTPNIRYPRGCGRRQQDVIAAQAREEIARKVRVDFPRQIRAGWITDDARIGEPWRLAHERGGNP
jgi:hypothetical protein